MGELVDDGPIGAAGDDPAELAHRRRREALLSVGLGFLDAAEGGDQLGALARLQKLPLGREVDDHR